MLAGPRPVCAISRFFLESAERWDLIPARLIRERPKVSTLESGFQQPENKDDNISRTERRD
jgi:hypothetical protein